MDASNLLKPFLVNGDRKCMGSTTFQECCCIFEHEHALARRFQKISIPEPSVADTISILKGSTSGLERHHDVRYTNAALVQKAELFERYINNSFCPIRQLIY